MRRIVLKSLYINDHNNLHDIWRILHPEKREFTHKTNITGGTTEARIDYFLISEEATKSTNQTSILSKEKSPINTSNHVAIELIINNTTKYYPTNNNTIPPPRIIRKKTKETNIQKYHDLINQD